MPTVPYTKQTWTDGVHAASAARLAVIENGIYDVSLAPAVRVTHNANQSINNATSTLLSFNTETFDQASGASDTMHDTSSNNSRLTCRYAGVYSITASILWAANATGYRSMALKVNNTTFIASDTIYAGAAAVQQGLSTHYALAVNDYVEVFVEQTSGGALNVANAASYSPIFTMVRVA